MRYYRIFIILILVSSLIGCQTTGKPNETPDVFTSNEFAGVKPWTDTGFQNDPDRFQFAIISDLHGAGIPGVFEEAVKRINLMQPEFVVSIGDLVNGYSEDEAEINRQRDEFDRFITPLNMRFFYVPGNHDITNMTMSDTWKERYGPTYYHFLYKNVLFLCLNTEDPPATHISKEQVEYSQNVLAQYPDVRWTIVLLHKPMWMMNPSEWAPVESLLADRPHTVFAGHVHVYENMERNGHQYVRLSVTGGGNALRGPGYGEFNQIAWVTMTDTGPVIANLDLNGIMDENLSTEPLSMIEAMATRSWFDADALVCDSDKFQEGSAVFNFTNPGGLPLKINCTFQPHTQLAVSEQQMEFILPPRSKKDVVLAVKAGMPMSLADVDPLEYKVSAVYHTPDGEAMSSDTVRALDIRYGWQGPELVQNKSFSRGLQQWIYLKKTPQSADITVEKDTVKISVFEKDFRYAMVLAQTLGELKADTGYQLNIKARCVGGANKIGVGIRDGDNYAPMLIDGKAEPRHLIPLDDKMTKHEINFRIAKETDVASGILVFTFLTENEVVVDEVSLRSVDKALMAKK